MRKAPEAFRTISEVAELLQTPAHVLRFWETKFTQVRPVKRAGGRRYYRPADLKLLSGIRTLLHDRGMTIRGVQKMLQEHGVRHVAEHASERVLAVLDVEVIDDAEAASEDVALEPADDGVADAEATDAPIPDADDTITPPAASDSVPTPLADRADAPDASLDTGSAEAASASNVIHPTAPDAAEHVEADPRENTTPAEPDIADTSSAGAPAGEGPVPVDGDTAPAHVPAEATADESDPDPACDQADTPEAAAETSAHAVTRDDAPENAAPPAPPAVPAPRLAVRLRRLDAGRIDDAGRSRLHGAARRIDALLDRMSVASGAGRW